MQVKGVRMEQSQGLPGDQKKGKWVPDAAVMPDDDVSEEGHCDYECPHHDGIEDDDDDVIAALKSGNLLLEEDEEAA